MPALQVRDFPADLYEELKARAKRESRSLSQQTIVAVREHLATPQGQTVRFPAHTENGEWRIARRKALFEEMDRKLKIDIPPSFPSPAEIIREIRDAR
jgi:plasmid stability protein